MSTTTLTTVLGMVMAGGMALATYLQTGGNPKDPLYWIGLIIAVATALKGYYTQGIQKTLPVLGLLAMPGNANAQLFGYWRGRYDESQRQPRQQQAPAPAPSPVPQTDP